MWAIGNGHEEREVGIGTMARLCMIPCARMSESRALMQANGWMSEIAHGVRTRAVSWWEEWCRLGEVKWRAWEMRHPRETMRAWRVKPSALSSHSSNNSHEHSPIFFYRIPNQTNHQAWHKYKGNNQDNNQDELWGSNKYRTCDSW